MGTYLLLASTARPRALRPAPHILSAPPPTSDQSCQDQAGRAHRDPGSKSKHNDQLDDRNDPSQRGWTHALLCIHTIYKPCRLLSLEVDPSGRLISTLGVGAGMRSSRTNPGRDRFGGPEVLPDRKPRLTTLHLDSRASFQRRAVGSPSLQT